MIIGFFIILFYGAMILGSIILLIWAINSRRKEKSLRKKILIDIKNTNIFRI